MSTSQREKGSSIIRVMDILEAVATRSTPASPTDLAFELDIPKATAHRLIQTMESEGLLQVDMRGHLMPSGRLLNIALGILDKNQRKIDRQAILASLAEQTGETCGISIPDGAAMIYLDRVQTNWPLQIHLPIGGQVPVWCTSGGKLYLSQLPDAQLKRLLKNLPLEKKTRNTLTDPGELLEELEHTRQQGYGIDNEEFIDGMVACSIPVMYDGKFHASLFCHAPVLRKSLQEMEALVPVLQKAAKELEQLLMDDAANA